MVGLGTKTGRHAAWILITCDGIPSPLFNPSRCPPEKLKYDRRGGQDTSDSPLSIIMHRTLDDLPNELILLAIELGEFDVRDALHVRWVSNPARYIGFAYMVPQTSRRLRQISTMTSFWLPTALKIQKIRPLPLPPFRPLESLTAQELMFICIRHQCITDNLNATQPTPWMTRQLSVGSEQGLVEYFAFIPGGRHAIIYHGGSDSFHLLDLGFAPERAASSLDDPANNPLQAGRILASFHPDFVNRVEMFDFYTCGENESTIMIATVSMVE